MRMTAVETALRQKAGALSAAVLTALAERDTARAEVARLTAEAARLATEVRSLRAQLAETKGRLATYRKEAVLARGAQPTGYRVRQGLPRGFLKLETGEEG